MKVVEMHIQDILSNGAGQWAGEPCRLAGRVLRRLDTPPHGSPTGRARARAACMPVWSKGRPRR